MSWERDMESEKRGKEMMDKLSDFFNSGDYKAQEAFVTRFQYEHRTLQQNILRGMFKIMAGCANGEPHRIDGRNEASYKACQIMIDAYKEKHNGIGPNEGLPLV